MRSGFFFLNSMIPGARKKQNKTKQITTPSHTKRDKTKQKKVSRWMNNTIKDSCSLLQVESSQVQL